MDELRSKLKTKYGYESVFVVHANEFNPLLKEGYNPFNHRIMQRICDNGRFMYRFDVEYNPTYRQILPYVVIRHGKLIYRTQRLEGSGEDRLKGKVSIGQGGHVNIIDSLFDSLIMNSVIREVHEEFYLYCNIKANTKFKGFLNDNGTPVSQDHLGVVVLLDVSKPTTMEPQKTDSGEVKMVEVSAIKVKETDKLTGGWATLDELRKDYDNMESWSQIVFKYLEERMKG